MAVPDHDTSPQGHVSAATAGPIHTPRFVMLDQAVESFFRRQASVNVDRDGRVAYAQRRTVVCLFVCEAELPLQGLLSIVKSPSCE